MAFGDFVQSAVVNGTTKPYSVTLGAGATAGNLIVIVACGTGTAGNPGTWSCSGFTVATSDPFSGYSVAILYKIAAGGETSLSVTNTYTTGLSASVIAAEYTGPFNATPLDKIANDGSNSGSGVTSRATGTTGTTTQASELAIVAVGQGNTVTSLSWSNSFTARVDQQQTGSGVHLGDKVLSATGTQTSTASWTTSRIAGGCIATFLASAAATNAPAGAGSATATGQAPTPSVAPNAGLSSATATGQTPAVSLSPNAGNASATATAYNATVNVQSNAGAATATATGRTPSCSVSPNGGVASATATGLTPSASVKPNAGLATATTTGLAPGINLAPSAGLASATATGRTPTIWIQVSGGLATVTATAYLPTISHATALAFAFWELEPSNPRWALRASKPRWQIEADS